jgi:cytochrome P450 family 6
MELDSIVIYAILPLVLLVYYYLKHTYSYFEHREVSHLPPSWILGNMNGVGTKIHLAERIQEIYNKFRDTSKLAGMYMITRPTIVAIDPELIKSILVKDFNLFPDRGMFHNEVDDVFSAHLFSLEGEKWKFLRNKLSPTFTSGIVVIVFS